MSQWPSPEQRFWARVDRAGDCWLWSGSKVEGYGQFVVGGRQVKAHRFSYERHVGAIPSGLEIDHLCRNRACVNPAHLEAVTHSVNVKRGAYAERRRNQTHCKRGHSLADAYVGPNGFRNCRVCRRMHWRHYYDRKTAAA